jgi:transcriptional regulator GlxA family with amidase domain
MDSPTYPEWVAHHMSTRALLRAIEYCDACFLGNVDLDMAASEGGLSPRHFRRQFRRVTGETPQAYLLRLRLEHAAHILIFSNRTAVQVAVDCVFESREGFVRAFTRQFGRTPEQFRGWGRRMFQKRAARAGRPGAEQSMSVEIREGPPRRVADLRCRGELLAIL